MYTRYSRTNLTYENQCEINVETLSSFDSKNIRKIENNANIEKKLFYAENLPINVLYDQIQHHLIANSMEPIAFFQHAITRLIDDFKNCINSNDKRNEDIKTLNSKGYILFGAFCYSMGFNSCMSTTLNTKSSNSCNLSSFFALWSYLKKQCVNDYIFSKILQFDSNKRKNIYVESEIVFLYTGKVQFLNSKNDNNFEIQNLSSENMSYIFPSMPTEDGKFIILPIHFQYCETMSHFFCLLLDKSSVYILDINPAFVYKSYNIVMHDNGNKTNVNMYNTKNGMPGVLQQRYKEFFKGSIMHEVVDQESFHNHFFHRQFTGGVCEILTRSMLNLLLNMPQVTNFNFKIKIEYICSYDRQFLERLLLNTYNFLFTDQFLNFFHDHMKLLLKRQETFLVEKCLKDLDMENGIYIPSFIEYNFGHFQKHLNVCSLLSNQKSVREIQETCLKQIYMRIMYPNFQIYKLAGTNKIITLSHKDQLHLLDLHKHVILFSKEFTLSKKMYKKYLEQQVINIVNDEIQKHANDFIETCLLFNSFYKEHGMFEDVHIPVMCYFQNACRMMGITDIKDQIYFLLGLPFLKLYIN